MNRGFNNFGIKFNVTLEGLRGKTKCRKMSKHGKTVFASTLGTLEITGTTAQLTLKYYSP